jgi:hypothetical protein
MCCDRHTLRLTPTVTSPYLAEPDSAAHKAIVAAQRQRTRPPVVTLGLAWTALKEPVALD